MRWERSIRSATSSARASASTISASRRCTAARSTWAAAQSIRSTASCRSRARDSDLLIGKPIYSRGPEVELTTPTGAAIVSTLAGGFGPMPPMSITSAGYGAGDKDFPEHANVVRVLIGDATGATETTTVVVIETNIDDSTPRASRLRDGEAARGRSARRVVHADPDEEEPAGIEADRRRANRRSAKRWPRSYFARLQASASACTTPKGACRAAASSTWTTPYGPVRVKISQTGAASPEFEDCRQLAANHNVPLKQVMAEATLGLPERRRMKYYLTTPIYYVNAAPHIGHAYTTIAADTIKRIKRMEGYDAYLTTGTDEHGQKIERAAKAAGQDAEAIHRRHLRRVPQSVEGARTSTSTSSSGPRARSTRRPCRTCFSAACDNGYIYKGSYTGQYCVYDELYVNDAKPGDPCPDCGRTDRNGHRRELLLQAFGVSGQAAAALRGEPEFILPETRRNEVLAFVRQGLTDLSISRTTHQVGHSATGGRQPRVLCVVRCAHHLQERRGRRRSVAGRPAPDRQGDCPLPRDLLAGVPDGRRLSACRSASSRTAGCCLRTTR